MFSVGLLVVFPAPPARAVEGTLTVQSDIASFSGTLTQAGNQPIRTAFGPLRLDYKSGPNAWTTGLLIREGDGNVTIGAGITSADFNATSKLRVLGTVESTTGGFKFPDATTQTSAATGMTSGMIAFFAAACPSGWTEYTAARGLYIVANPLSGTLATAVGTALTNLENRAVGQHAHSVSDPGHSHQTNRSSSQDSTWSVYIPSQGNGVAAYTGSSSTGVTVLNSGSVAGTNAPYIQLTACQKD